MLPLVAGLFVLLCSVRSVRSTGYNWSITDQSPLITYDPIIRGGNATTWNSTFSASSWAKYPAGDWDSICGYGKSAHTSAADNASATVNFIGTAVYVWGEADQLSAVVYVDGLAQGSSEGQSGFIAAVTDLANDWHEVKVVAAGLMPVSVEGFTFTSRVEGQPTNSSVNVVLSALQTNLNVTGDWDLQFSTVQDVVTGKVVNYTTFSTDSYSLPTLTLQPPINTTMVFINGLLSSYGSPYSVNIEPNQNATVPVPQNQTFNGTTDWTSGNQVLYQAMLTPGQQYTITIEVNEEVNYGGSFGIGSITYVQVPPQSTKKISKGAIAAIVIVLLVVLGSVYYIFFTSSGRRLRSRLRRPPPTGARKDIDNPTVPNPAHPHAIPLSNIDLDKSDVSLAQGSAQNRDPAPLQIPHDTPSQLIDVSPLSYRTVQTSSDESTSPTGVSRREKEDSMAALLPHLISSVASSSQAGSPTTRRLLGPLRDVDAGPITEEVSSPILPPEYEPSWAQHRTEGQR